MAMRWRRNVTVLLFYHEFPKMFNLSVGLFSLRDVKISVVVLYFPYSHNDFLFSFRNGSTTQDDIVLTIFLLLWV